MAERLYAVTGASSGLGQRLVEALSRRPSARVVALVSGRRAPPPATDNVSYLAQNLCEPLSQRAEEVLRGADRIAHLAWARPRAGSLQEVTAQNMRMVETLLAIPGVGRRLVFVSSVAASPRAGSTYGRVKYLVQERVLRAGGVVLVCGLVVSNPPETAFKALVDMLKRLPVGIRLVPNAPRVYPVWRDDLVAVMMNLVSEEVPPGAYRAFAREGLAINEFIAWTMDRFSIRKTMLPAPQFAIAPVARIARLLGLHSLAEKLGTFFFKDAGVLQGLLDPPGTALSGTDSEFGEIGQSR